MGKEQGQKKRFLKPLAVICILIIAAVIPAAVLHFRIGAKSAALLRLTDLIEADTAGFELDAAARIDGQEYRLQAEIRISSADYSVPITAITWNGMSLYYTENVLFLEDGTAYRLTEGNAASEADSEPVSDEEADSSLMDTDAAAVPDYFLLLSLIKAYYADTEIVTSETDGSMIYSITLDQESGMELLSMLFPSAAKQMKQAEDLIIDLYVTDGAAESIVISCGIASAADDNNAEIFLDVNISMMDEESSVFTVPDAVLSALADGDWENAPVLTNGVLELLAAWNALNEQESFGAAIALHADLGPISLSPKATWIRTQEEDSVVNQIIIGGITIVYEEGDNGQMDEDLSEEESAAVSLTFLLNMAYENFLQGSILMEETEDSTVYTVNLTSEQMEQIVTTLIPDAAQLQITYEDGRFEAVVTDGKFESLFLECSGSIAVLLAEVPIGLTAEIQMLDITSGMSAGE